MKLLTVLYPIAVSLGLSSGGFAAEIFKKREIRLDQAPQSVQSAIQEHVRNGKLDELEKVTLDGKTLYIAEIKLPQKRDLDLYFAEDGSLMKSAEEIHLADVPAAVRTAVEALAAAHGKIDEIDKVTVGSTVTFHFEIDRRGPDLHLVVSPDGQILEERSEADD
jgi:hypothetical protein